jgi:hypothetical protein
LNEGQKLLPKFARKVLLDCELWGLLALKYAMVGGLGSRDCPVHRVIDRGRRS